MRPNQALSLSLEQIEAQAFADVYRAVPASYASANRVHLRDIEGGACLTHSTIVIPELDRVVGVMALDDVKVACDWMAANAVPGWVVQMPPVFEDVTRYLKEKGFRPIGNGWAKFCREVPTDDMVYSSELTVRTIEPAQAESFATILADGFGLPLNFCSWLAAVVGRPNWTVQLAYSGVTPVSCGALYSNGQVAWMGMDATLPDHRRKGGQSLLIRSRLRVAAELGVKSVTAETGQPDADKTEQHASFSNYRRAGFTQLYTRPNFAHPADER
ncbi:GNAT family N-acetyltransferase [Rhizobium sp. BE258]|jgi:GNAT superfamily N-acetyltransferase|uniref:GNAT family N-acetyltransferase n=1 Tax=Rhizobium sp. BE258 TaxID=2817722 RepID=UPI002860F8D6|nr:GNAT family N-acetyltransferase [Rhizobium sp. BE258]MDR7147772.1 GNAT superfamily N-acetyltransferase [Rhizobium sp. BE258]